MVLITPEALERLKHEPVRARANLETIKGELDDVLTDKKLGDHDKWRKYVNLFQTFMHRMKEQNEPLKINITEDIDSEIVPNEQNNKQPNVSRIIKEVPKLYQNKAKLLIDRIKESRISWDDRGEVSVSGTKIPNSNISDLVNDVLRKRKDFNPIGWELFVDELHRINVPLEIIGNPSRQIREPPRRSPSPDWLVKTPKGKKRKERTTRGEVTQWERLVL